MAAIERIEAGVDWLQFTLAHDSPHASSVAEAYVFCSNAEEENGNLPHEVQFLGFEGHACGHVTLASNRKTRRLLFKCSGAVCDEYLDQVIAIALHSETTVTRLDVRCDIWYSDYDGQLAFAIAERLKKLNTGKKRGAPLFLDGFGAGDTLYFGRPSSDRRLRLYDKFREQDNADYWRNCWRYEVQYRQTFAKHSLQHIANSPPVSEACAGIINSEYSMHGILPVPDARAAVRPRAIQRDSDIDRRARWLQNQVGPAAREIAIARGWEYVISLIKGG